jgi:fructose-1,6-bisphosphatase-3
MHKAITIIQLKLEGQVIKRRPEFQMTDRLLLDKISSDLKHVHIHGQTYDLLDDDFPTLDLDHPFQLTLEEQMVMDKLSRSFLTSDKLSKHTSFLFKKGSMYLNYNGNLLYHGGVPIREDLSFKTFKYNNHYYQGKELFDFFETMVKKGFTNHSEESFDFMWYLWNGPCSPLYAKNKMATFERYFLEEKHLHKEIQNAYFKNRDNEALINRILSDFQLRSDFTSIISGHVPVKASDGENPVKCKEKMFVIDGGFSKAYHQTTGIAGYTLTFNSRGMMLVAHEPFDSLKSAIEEESDSLPMTVYTKTSPQRLFVKDTDIGKNIQEDINTLKTLLEAYENHQLKEREVYKNY